MIRKFMTTVALGSLFAGGLAVSHLALAQDGVRFGGPRGDMFMMADANKDGAVTRAELTAALETRFARLDVNKDGKLSKEDRDLARQQLLDARFAEMDSDKNGQISRAEFDAAHQHRDGQHDRMGHGGRGWGHKGPGRGMIDADRDGTLTKAEFMARPLALFDQADANKDGKVTADEWKAARQSMRDAWRDRNAPPPPPPAN
jgi:hypothetical protein